MLTIALYIGLCYQAVAPQLIKPGMTIEQVEAILQESATFRSIYGSLSDYSIASYYPKHRLTIWYDVHDEKSGVYVVHHPTPELVPSKASK